MKRLHLIIKGKVQGVFYRHNTVKQGHKLGIKGFVRNLPNGDVEVIAEGPEDKLKQLCEWCKKGPDNAEVDEVQEKWQEPYNDYVSFETRH
ncbi:MAG: acylphosphatase [Nanoarchaeota archaeon]|nr:acylphosphatase [Nanoarchaeota archaeon]